MLRWIFCAALVLATAAGASAQPAKPDLAEAASLYRAAEQAMAERRYDDASRDYGAAYEISKDAVLFFKIGSALDKGGKCPVAVTYYRRYLREGKPTAEHQKLTNERITACEGERKPDDGAAGSGEKAAGDKPKAEAGKGRQDGAKPGASDKAKPGASDKAKPSSDAAAAAQPDGTTSTSADVAAPGAPLEAAPGATVASAAPGDAAATPPASGPSSTTAPTAPVDAAEPATAEPEPAEPEPAEPTSALASQPAPGDDDATATAYPPPPLRRTAGWLAVGGGIAFVTIGAVLALAAESTEDDLADFYIVRAGGEPLVFNGSTQRRYDELVERGDRYQTLTWVSFGIAAAAGAAATYFFLTSPDAGEGREPTAVAVQPLLSPTSAGVGASWGF